MKNVKETTGAVTEQIRHGFGPLWGRNPPHRAVSNTTNNSIQPAGTSARIFVRRPSISRQTAYNRQMEFEWDRQ